MKLKTLLREANENPMLKELEQQLKSHDWYYWYSDDRRYYEQGEYQTKKIRELVAQINRAGLTGEGNSIWKKTAPTEFKSRYPKKLSK